METINKLWGSEQVLYNGPTGYCMKILTLMPGFQSSLHFHPTKHETFLVVEGCCDLEVAGTTHRFVRGDFMVVPPGIQHRFKGVDGKCVIVESSTHHSDDDVIRIEPSKEIK